MLNTFAPSGKDAMYTIARPTSCTSNVASGLIVPSACGTPFAAPPPIAVAAFPMSTKKAQLANVRPSVRPGPCPRRARYAPISSWHAAMLYFLPSRLVHFVSPAMACLLIVYEVASTRECQRGPRRAPGRCLPLTWPRRIGRDT